MDPEEWKHGDKGGVDRHYRMTLAEWEFYRPGLGPYAPVDGIRDINHVRSKPGQPFGSMKDTPVLLHIKFRSLVEEGLIKHFRFGETPAPEDLLFALFSMAPK